MSISMEVKCDICNESKKPSNGWTIGFSSPGYQQISPLVQIYKWDDKRANEPGAKHLCGTECEAKFVTRITSTWRGVSSV
jgi:hypothetical protein